MRYKVAGIYKLVAILPRNMKSEKQLQKRKDKQTENKLAKNNYRIVIGLLIFGCIYYYFIQPKTIGHDIRYNIYIFLMPTLAGIFTLGMYRRNFLINKFIKLNGFALRAFMVFIFFIQGIIFSYLIFGQIANIGWNIINQNVAKDNPVEVINCEITNFFTGKNSNNGIYYTFHGRSEKIKTNFQTIKFYLDKNPDNYKLEIKIQKGIWNHYLLKEWTIREIKTATNSKGFVAFEERTMKPVLNGTDYMPSTLMELL